jgi:hypothetical protein
MNDRKSWNMHVLSQARLAQSVERETFNLKAKGSSPLSGEFFFAVC